MRAAARTANAAMASHLATPLKDVGSAGVAGWAAGGAKARMGRMVPSEARSPDSTSVDMPQRRSFDPHRSRPSRQAAAAPPAGGLPPGALARARSDTRPARPPLPQTSTAAARA